ncbi:CAP domain-containing protein [Priestia megaterium]
MNKIIGTMLLINLLFPIATHTASAAENNTYTVVQGDTLWKIAVKTKTGIHELIKANPQVKNIDLIYPNQKLNVPTKANTSEKQQVINIVNEKRKAAGLNPLTENWELSRVAQYKAEDMHDKGYFDHNSPTYGSPFKMMKDFGIKYGYAGENIAKGQRSPQEVMNSWMNSQGHRENILSPNFKHIGVGYDARGHEWVQQFTD